MDSREDHHNHIVTVLTIVSIFMMGFIDAYTFAERNGTFASAQTGNMVSFGAKLFQGEWAKAAGHLSVLAGFMLGAFGGEAVLQNSKKLGIRRYRLFLLIKGVLLLFLAIFQNGLADSPMVFFLGLLAGYELTTFRKLHETTINNGIMTGNTKNLMNNLYKAVYNKDQKAKKDCKNLLTGIIVFLLGVGGGTWVLNMKTEFVLWAAFLIIAISFIWLVFSKYEKE